MLRVERRRADSVVQWDEIASRRVSLQGLTSEEAAARLRSWGPNELGRTRRFEAGRQIVGWLASPLIIILLLASVISAGLEQLVSSIVISLMGVLGVAPELHPGVSLADRGAAPPRTRQPARDGRPRRRDP